MTDETDRTAQVSRLLELHRPGAPLLCPNPWDPGSARVLASLGFEALATTSSGLAGALGRRDGGLSGEQALAQAAQIAAAVDVPVTADLEDGYADTPEGVAQTVRLAAEAGLAGCSIEDWGGESAALTDLGPAVERVAAAAEVARDPKTRLVLTARAENFLRGRPDLDDTIARLRAFREAGADVVYAPALIEEEAIARVVREVDAPLNVLFLPGTPTVARLAELGVARISVGGAFHLASLAALASAAREWKEQGTHAFWPQALAGATLARTAFD